jgi:alkanesulfonate monooxygenase SsuD/methylene tetrahydromethanopterin reductase-like flavin-dependent oxidoreductase (luciferase family)
VGGGSFIYVGERGCRISRGLLEEEPLRARRNDGDRHRVAGDATGTRGSLVLDWAGRADSGPFSSLGIIDRLVYPNYETLVTLAAAAAVTERGRLMSTVLIAPLRGAGVPAKQAASVDALSGGRLTPGLGVGAREDDFQVASAPLHDRARRFEEQLDLMKRVWSGQPVGGGVGPIGPPPTRPGEPSY